MGAGGPVLVWLIAVLLSGCGLRRQDFLDATKAVVRTEPGHTIESGGLFGSSPRTPERSYPLRVRLLKFDRRAYRQMDRIAYDVSIANISAVSIALPWSPSPISRRDRPASGYRHAIFEFIIVKSGQPDAVAHMFVLYGAPTVPRSLKELRPGERAIVRLPGTFSGSGFQDARNPILYPEANMRAKVGLSLYSPGDVRFNEFHEEFSENTLPIIIAAAPRRDSR